MNTQVIQDIIEAEANFVSVAISCDDEDAYVKALTRLGIERDDVIDEKSPHVFTAADMNFGKITVQYRAGKPESTDSDDEEE